MNQSLDVKHDEAVIHCSHCCEVHIGEVQYVTKEDEETGEQYEDILIECKRCESFEEGSYPFSTFEVLKYL